jgi:NAD(P)-dependent dehydrogenase (short-subunit alcohol dehydrogenase family)
MHIGTALVTGAGRGYGLELCRGLAARGAHVFGVVRGAEGAASFVDVAGASGTLIRADVTNEEAGALIAAALPPATSRSICSSTMPG